MHPMEIHIASVGAMSQSDQTLIWELVANINPAADILKRHGLTVADLRAKQRDKLWAAAYREAKVFWESNAGVRERIKQKAGMLLEDALMDIQLIIKDPMIPTVHKLEATKQLGQLSQTSNPKTQPGEVGAGFKLTINISDSKKRVIEGTVVEQQAIEAE
jgi:hypothetical protein